MQMRLMLLYKTLGHDSSCVLVESKLALDCLTEYLLFYCMGVEL